MSFDALRQHQRKIQIPLAIVVIIIFVFFFGAGPGIRSLFRPTEKITTDAELLRLGHDLQAARLISPPRTKQYEAWARKDVEEIEFKNEDEKNQRIREMVTKEVESYYRRAAALEHRLPVDLAGELGVQVTDAELNERVREHAKKYLGLEKFNQADYKDELDIRSLSVERFEELLRGQMLARRVNSMLSMAAGASESEQFEHYAREREKVRVQYFQRQPTDFLTEVEMLPGKRPEKKKAAKKLGKEEEKEKEKEKEEEDLGLVYEEDIKKAYDKRCDDFDKAYDYRKKLKEKDEKFKWPARLAASYPDLFTEPQAKIEYLVALNKDFEREVKVSGEEITDHYNNNKHLLYKIKPKKAAPPKPKRKPKPKPKPQYRKLDRKLKREIRKKLLAEKATDAAAAAVDKAVKEYNEVKLAEKRPKLRDLARKHKLHLRTAGPATIEDLEEAEYLKDLIPSVHDLFQEFYRKKLKEDLTARRPVEKDRGFLAIRMVKFHPVALLSFEKAKAGLTYRVKLEAAWDLAEKACKKDLKDLKDGKLDPKQVRASTILGPGDETCKMVVGYKLTVGEVSRAYTYGQLLGKEDREHEAREKAEKESGKKKTKPLEERITDTYRVGWRVIILLERRTPDIKEFRADRRWRGDWKPLAMMARYYQMMGRTPGDTRWRQVFLNDLYRERYRRLNTKKSN